MDVCNSDEIEKGVALPDEPSETTVNKTTYPKSRGDGYVVLGYPESQQFYKLPNIETVSLCSVDKMRIDHLISELDKCRKSQRETELRLAANKSENKAMYKTFESCYNKHKDDEANLRSKLATETRELRELTTNTTYSLDTLVNRISAWEVEIALIRAKLDELLNEKINLKNELNKLEIKNMLLTNEETRINYTIKMNEIYLRKDKLKTDIMLMLTRDKSFQTEEISLP